MLGRTGQLVLMSGLLAAGGALAQTPPLPASSTFLTDQALGHFRASKFVGLDVYGPDNQKVGDINEILIDRTGAARAAIIGGGGFLGIGEKKVAVPFESLGWSSTRNVAATGTLGAVLNPPPVAVLGAVSPDPNAGTTARPMRSAEENAAYEGSPDHATVTMTKAELQNAPSFKYYAETHPSTLAPATMPPRP